MNTLPKDILGIILAKCDTFKDYCSWSLVNTKWHNKISVGIQNILTTILNGDIGRMVGLKHFDRFYLGHPNQLVNNQYTIEGPTNTLFFLYWGSSSVVKSIEYYHLNELVHEMKKESDWTTDHAYWYGSKMPNISSVGYVCVKVVGVVDRIVLHFKEFAPILIAIN